MSNYVIWFEKLGMDDVPVVGGKNASLGEMISNLASAGISVPGGFATTAEAFRDFLSHNDLDSKINGLLQDFDVEDVDSLEKVGAQIRESVMQTPFPAALEQSVREAYSALQDGGDISVAVRSSATAEDLTATDMLSLIHI